jgi:hypothetical protein
MMEHAGTNMKVYRDGDLFYIKDGRTEIKLPIMSSDNFFYTDPKAKPTRVIRVDKQFFDSLARAVDNCLPDAYKEALCGVTMIVGKKIELYAYDFSSLLTFKLPFKNIAGDTEVTVIFSSTCASRASKIFDELGNKDQQVEIRLSSKYVIFDYLEAGVVMVSHVVDAKPIDFRAEIKAFPADTEMFELPPKMKSGLERCVALLGKNLAGVVKFTLGDHGIFMACNGMYGDADIPLKTPPLPELTIDFNPRILLRHIDVTEHYAFTNGKKVQAIHFVNDTMKFYAGRYPVAG